MKLVNRNNYSLQYGIDQTGTGTGTGNNILLCYMWQQQPCHEWPVVFILSGYKYRLLAYTKTNPGSIISACLCLPNCPFNTEYQQDIIDVGCTVTLCLLNVCTNPNIKEIFASSHSQSVYVDLFVIFLLLRIVPAYSCSVLRAMLVCI